MSRLLPLAVFTPDRQTGSMKELTNGELTPYALTRDPTFARHLSVLVVDNNKAELQSTTRQLAEAWPFARDLVVECATDAVEAVEKIRGYRYAFVVLDWNVPHSAGTNGLLAIRAAGLRVPAVVVSTKGRATIASNLESLGAAFVNKRKLNPTRFCNAMAAAILLTERVFGPVRAVPLRVCKSASFPAQAVEARFAKRSLPLSVRPTALVGLSEPKIAVRETPRGNHTSIPRMVAPLKKLNSVAGMQTPHSRFNS